MKCNKVGIANLSAFNVELLTERKSDFYERMQKPLRVSCRRHKQKETSRPINGNGFQK